jgi:hypothetical protein
MSQGAIGWINSNFLSIDLFGDPALIGRLSIVADVLTHTASFKDRNVRGHFKQPVFLHYRAGDDAPHNAIRDPE